MVIPPARLVRWGRAYVAENATVTGRVALGEDANVWYAVTIRGDDAKITIGARTNVQDGTVIHADPDRDNVIGEDVTIGHGAVCHGVEIRDRALIGMGAILLGGSIVGEGAVVAAGCLVSENMEIPPNALAVGVPARIVKILDAAARRENALESARDYVEQARRHVDGAWDGMVEA
jgi:carbonic anhydrase/acetyltransferase-like protein (isoleucine patch superfamily)